MPAPTTCGASSKASTRSRPGFWENRYDDWKNFWGAYWDDLSSGKQAEGLGGMFYGMYEGFSGAADANVERAHPTRRHRPGVRRGVLEGPFLRRAARAPQGDGRLWRPGAGQGQRAAQHDARGAVGRLRQVRQGERGQVPGQDGRVRTGPGGQGSDRDPPLHRPDRRRGRIRGSPRRGDRQGVSGSARKGSPSSGSRSSRRRRPPTASTASKTPT